MQLQKQISLRDDKPKKNMQLPKNNANAKADYNQKRNMQLQQKNMQMQQQIPAG
jgi:hypothetical protein